MIQVLLIGSGLLGESVARLVPDNSVVKHVSRRNSQSHQIEACDITCNESIDKLFAGTPKPQFVINCSAMSAVDECEAHPQKARNVNALAVKKLAMKSKECGAYFIHVSTDYVFSGQEDVKLLEDDEISPCSIYGMSKAEGEYHALTQTKDSCIIRTSWLFGHARVDFVSTMFDKLSRDESISVIHRQIGSPTYSDDLANVIWKICRQPHALRQRIYHFANKNPTTRFDMVKKMKRHLKSKSVVNPIEESSVTNWTAMRPLYSVLSCELIQRDLDFVIRPWEDAFTDYCLSRGKNE